VDLQDGRTPLKAALGLVVQVYIWEIAEQGCVSSLLKCWPMASSARGGLWNELLVVMTY
jgi:hypothetical protein